MKKSLFVAFAVIAGLSFHSTTPLNAQAAQPPTTVVLKASRGEVTFNHAAHTKVEGARCATCHHASKPEKPMTAAQEACSRCHTSTPTPPMKTNLQAAVHDTKTRTGLCFDCHVKENAAGRNAPVKCGGCHKRPE